MTNTKKVSLPIKDSHRVINPGPVILVSSGNEEARTISTIAWHMPVSSSPKLVGVALAHKRYTLELIKQSNCFCVNVPDHKILEQVVFCGTYSGRKIDKYKETGLTPAACKAIGGFYVDECVAHIECEVAELIEAGDHTIVLGKVVEAYTNEELITQDGVIDINKVELIQHLGGSHFGTLKKKHPLANV
ncbi:MAG: flavin reductase family protein [bacterium]|nr:flavin reductase family protein [bacterium]